MGNYTLTYDEKVQGFPSFYTFYPEWMIGMNNYFYSFYRGNLWRHNVNETRNSFYDTKSSSILETVINKAPLENKLFKTISLESTDAWSTTVETDVDGGGSINSQSFVEKEGAWFSYLRKHQEATLTAQGYKARYTGGIGNMTSINGMDIKFDDTVPFNNIVSVGDNISYVDGADTEATIVGEIYSITPPDANGDWKISMVSMTGIPAVGEFILYWKDAMAESSGMLGHYATLTLALSTTHTSYSELFAIEMDVMKSYP